MLFRNRNKCATSVLSSSAALSCKSNRTQTDHALGFRADNLGKLRALLGHVRTTTHAQRSAQLTFCVLLIAAPGFLIGARATNLFVVNRPVSSDAILVLGGDFSSRYPAGVSLLRQGRAPQMIVSADDRHSIFGKSEADRSAEVAKAEDPSGSAISVCPVTADSTVEEATQVDSCLRGIQGRRVMLVTSGYHTRRALAVFRHQLPEYEWTVAAADEGETQNAVVVEEFAKLVWWNAVDRWRTRKGSQDAIVQGTD